MADKAPGRCPHAWLNVAIPANLVAQKWLKKTLVFLFLSVIYLITQIYLITDLCDLLNYHPPQTY